MLPIFDSEITRFLRKQLANQPCGTVFQSVETFRRCTNRPDVFPWLSILSGPSIFARCNVAEWTWLSRLIRILLNKLPEITQRSSFARLRPPGSIEASPCTMPTFPQFARLPIELQRAIWQSVLDEAPEPVVEISNTDKLAWGTDPREGGTSLSTLNSDEVYLNTNALMHVCHVSREMARKQLKFSQVEQGACLDPYRHFDPDVDALYISDPLNGRWSDVLRDAWPVEAAKIRHLALETAYMDDCSGLSGFVNNLGIFSSLRKVSLVCADDWAGLREYDPDGRVRYRLVDYSETETILQTACKSAYDQDRAQEIEAWSLAKSLQDMVIHEFMSRSGIACDSPLDDNSPPDHGNPPHDKTTGKFFFDIVPSRIEAIPESIPKKLAKEAYCATTISRLQRLLDSFFERLGCSPVE